MLGTVFQAGVAVGAAVWVPVQMFVTGVLYGVMILVSQHFGADRQDDIAGAARQGLWLALGLGAAASGLLYLLAPHLTLFGVTEDVAQKAEDYLQALATSAAMDRRLPYGTPITVLTHARRNLVHFQPYVSYGWSIPAQPAEDVRLCSPEDILARLTGTTGAVCGSGLQRNPALLAQLAEQPALLCLDQLRLPSIDALRLLARHGDYAREDIDPLYVRPCDAVDNLPQLAQRMGLDAGEAQAELQRQLQRPPSSME